MTNNKEPMPYFLIAKTMCNEYNNMLNEYMKNNEEEKKWKEALAESMKFAETSKSIDLH